MTRYAFAAAVIAPMLLLAGCAVSGDTNLSGYGRFVSPLTAPAQETAAEVVVGGLCLVSTLGMGWWVLAQRDRYDPGERDIDIAVLREQSVEDTLYKAPLARWVDPALAAAGAGSAAPAVELGWFPSGVLADGWQPASRLQTFTPDTLYEKINGQAEQYLRYGCAGMQFLSLAAPGGSPTVDVYLYDQGSFPNALGLFDEQRDPERAVEELGSVSFVPTSVGAIGMVGTILFHVIGSEASPAVAERTRAIVEALGQLAPAGGGDAGGGAPLGARVLQDVLGIPLTEVTYAPNLAFQYEFADAFWFGRPDPASDHRYFLHEAASEEAAAELFELMHEAQLGDFELVERAGTSALYRHLFLETYFALHRAGNLVYGVEEHADPDGIAGAVAELERALGLGSPLGSGEEYGE